MKAEGAGQYADSWKDNCSINDWEEEKWCFQVQGFDGQEESRCGCVMISFFCGCKLTYMSLKRVMRRQQTGDTGMLRQYSSNRAGREARSQRNGRREGGIEELTVKGHGSSDAGDPDKRRNGDDWTGDEAGWPR